MFRVPEPKPETRDVSGAPTPGTLNPEMKEPAPHRFCGKARDFYHLFFLDCCGPPYRVKG